MSNRLSQRQKTGGFNHKKGNTPYKHYGSKEEILRKKWTNEAIYA